MYADTFVPDGSRGSSYEAADYAFVDEYVSALDESRAHACSGEVGRHVIENITGIFEAAAYGVRVALPQQQPDRHPLLRWRDEADLGPPEPKPVTDKEWLAIEDARVAG